MADKHSTNENELLSNEVDPHDKIVSDDVLLAKAREALDLLDRVKKRSGQHSADGDGDTPDIKKFPGVTPALNEKPLGSTTVNDLLPGKRIGRFQLKRVLGQGGFGVVYLAFDPDLQRDVALKVPRHEVMATEELRARFFREGRAAAAVAHPNIVPVFETGAIGELCYTASQFIDGPSLAEYLENHQVSYELAARITRQLADAVEHAHQRGILHRDIKPSNILLETQSDESTGLENKLRLADFGMAKSVGDQAGQTCTGGLIGTPAYLPPEQIDDHQQIGPPSDVYSLGAVLYEMLVKRPPFVGDSLIETIDQVRSMDPVAPSRLDPKVPRDLEAICLKCLEKPPTRRYASSFELGQDLERFLNSEPVEARHIGSLQRMGRWYVRHQIPATAIALTIVFLIVGLVTSMFLYQNSQSNLKLATEQTKRAIQQSERANRSADRTQRSITKMLNEVATSLEDVPKMDGLRSRLLLDALELQREIFEDIHDEDSPARTLEAYQRLAAIHKQLGDDENTMEFLNKGLQLYDRLGEDKKEETPVKVAWANLTSSMMELEVARGDASRSKIDAAIISLSEIKLLDAASITSLASAYRRSGIDWLKRGKPQNAIADFEKALEALDQIAAPHGETAFMRAICLNSYAIALKQQRDYQRAIALYEELINLMQAQILEFPERVKYQDLLATVALNLGNAQFSTRAYQKSAEPYQLAFETSATLKELFPGRRFYQVLNANAAQSVGLAAYRNGDLPEAKQALQNSLDLWHGVSERFGHTWEVDDGLSRAHNSMANALVRLQELDAAKKHALAAIAIAEKQMVTFNTNPSFKRSLSLRLGNLANIEAEAKRYEEALALFQRACQVAVELQAERPDYPGQQSNINYQLKGIACVQAMLQDHDDALATVERIVDYPANKMTQMRSATATLAEVAQRLDEIHEGDQKETILAPYRERAVTLMKNASQSGEDTSDWLPTNFQFDWRAQVPN